MNFFVHRVINFSYFIHVEGYLDFNIKKFKLFVWINHWEWRDLNPHAFIRQRILSPSRLPIPPHSLIFCIKRTYIYIYILIVILPRIISIIKYLIKVKSVILLFLKFRNIGGTQIRTGDRGFAIHCLTTWPYRHLKLFLL